MLDLKYGGEYIDAFIPLWQDAFGDDAAAVREICGCCDENRIAVGYIDGAAAAGCLVMPCAYSGNNRPDSPSKAVPAPGDYYYAMTVRRDLRGRGLFRELCGALIGDSRARGREFALLVPSRREYFDMYSRLGFTATALGLTQLCRGNPAVDADDFLRMRPRKFDGGAERMLEMRRTSGEARFSLARGALDLALSWHDAAYFIQNGAETVGYVVTDAAEVEQFPQKSGGCVKIYDYCIYNGAKNYIIDVTEKIAAMYAVKALYCPLSPAMADAADDTALPTADIFLEG